MSVNCQKISFGIVPAKGRKLCQLGISVETEGDHVKCVTLHTLDVLRLRRAGSIETDALLATMISTEERRNTPKVFHEATRNAMGFNVGISLPSFDVRFPFSPKGNLIKDRIRINQSYLSVDRIMQEAAFDQAAAQKNNPYNTAVTTLSHAYNTYRTAWGVTNAVTSQQYSGAELLQLSASGLLAHVVAKEVVTQGRAGLFSIKPAFNTACIPTQLRPQSKVSAMWRDVSGPASIFISSGDMRAIQNGRMRVYCDRPLTYFDHWVNARIISALCGGYRRPYTEDQITQFAQTSNDIQIIPPPGSYRKATAAAHDLVCNPYAPS